MILGPGLLCWPLSLTSLFCAPSLRLCGHLPHTGVMPNKETEFLLLQIFGHKSYPMLKFVRMRLWFSRFKNVNPFPVPRDLPQDPVDLARLGLRHMEPDLSARVTVYQVSAPVYTLSCHRGLNPLHSAQKIMILG